jgi:dihydrolipoamide dehydrogenase
MSETQRYELAIIGGGPGGYVAAIRAAQLGLRACVVEKGRIGGVCLNWGCIPTKALLRSAEIYGLCKRAREFGIMAPDPAFDMAAAVERSRAVSEQVSRGVEYLLKQHKVPVIAGRGYLVSPHRVAVLDPADEPLAAVEAKNVLIATGARPRSIPGVRIDGEKVISSTEAMTLGSVPESIVIVGAGAVGVEFAYFFNAVGSKVTLLEMLPSVLPGEDSEISKLLARSFKKQGVETLTSARVRAVEAASPDGGEGPGVKVAVETEKGGKELAASLVLMAIGVRPNSDGLGLEDLGVGLDGGGFVEVDEHMRTSTEGLYAIGDVSGPPLLAHVASAEGIQAVETMAGLEPRPLRIENMPRCVYCQPEVASVGLSEEKALDWARERDRAIKVGRFPFRASGKSLAAGERDGIVKVMTEAGSGKMLGAAVIGGEATELIAEICLALEMGATAERILDTVHAHPTLSEAVMEAAGDALGIAIHKPADALGGGN